MKPQPAAGTSRLRGGIIWPCQLLGPWAGGRHVCCLAGSREEQWISLSLLIPAMFVTHVSGISPRLSSVLCSGGSHHKHLKCPVIMPGSPWCQSRPQPLCSGPCSRGAGMGCQQQGTQIPGDIWLPQQSPGNFQLFLGSPFHRGPLQGSPQLETSLVHTHVTSKTLATPVNWHRDPTSSVLQDLWGRAEDPAGFLCDPVTHQLLLGFSPVVDAHTALMNTPCHPLSRITVLPVPVMEQSRELGLLRMKQPDLHLCLSLFPSPASPSCFPFPFSLYPFPFPVHLFPSLFLFSFPLPAFPLPLLFHFPFSFPLPPSPSLFSFFPTFPFSFPLPLLFPPLSHCSQSRDSSLLSLCFVFFLL